MEGDEGGRPERGRRPGGIRQGGRVGQDRGQKTTGTGKPSPAVPWFSSLGGAVSL